MSPSAGADSRVVLQRVLDNLRWPYRDLFMAICMTEQAWEWLCVREGSSREVTFTAVLMS